MRQHLEEYGKYVEITGFRNIDFSQAETFLKANRKENQQNIDVQFFDASVIATREHLFFAALNALQAFRNGTNISKSLAMETILYASAQRQIQKAIQRCGIKPDTQNMAIIIIAEEQSELETMLQSISSCLGMAPDEAVLDMSEIKEAKIKRAFEISNEELAVVMRNGDSGKATVDLVIEQIALLSTQL
jgi:tRNA threonylcarbamoyladenosine modification (KEOPS) complex Cgi121 subunit